MNDMTGLEPGKETGQRTSTLDLVRQYFEICNKVLAQRRENPVYAAIQTLINHFHSGEKISLKVVDRPEVPGVPAGYYMTQYIDGRFTPISKGEHNPDRHFTLCRSYIEDVVDNADDYIDHPEKLDWNWLHG